MGLPKIFRFRVLFISLLALSLLVIAACGSSTSSPTSHLEEGNSEKYVLKANLLDVKKGVPEVNGSSHFITEWFMDEVEKRSDGRIRFDRYYSASLLPINATLDALANGSLDISDMQYQYFGDIIPSGLISNLPFWNKDAEDAAEIIYETEIGEIIRKDYEDYGVKTLMVYPTRSYGFLLKKPVHTLEDFKGLQLRQSGGTMGVWFEELGITGVDISFNDLYDALSRGVIDGTVTAPTVLNTSKLHEVVDYVLEPSFVPTYLCPVFISTKTWEKLPKDLQDIIVEVSEEAVAKAIEYDEGWYEEEMEEAKAAGVEFIQLSEDEQKRLFESAQKSWDYFASLGENNARIVEILRERQGQ